jgi:hypothetical protein
LNAATMAVDSRENPAISLGDRGLVRCCFPSSTRI